MVLASVDLCKLSGVVKNGVVETTGYYNRLKGSKILRLLIPAIQLKMLTDYDTKLGEVERKILNYNNDKQITI